MTSARRLSAGRRAFALLATLVAVVLIMTAIGGLISALGEARAQTATTDDREHLVDLLACGEQLALDWTTTHSASVVFPPEGGRVALVHDVMTTDDGDAELEVDLYDGCAHVPVAGAMLRSPLRLALSGPWQSLAPIDALSPSDALERLQVPEGLRRFPIPSGTPPTVWGDQSPPVTPLAAIGGAPSLAEVVSPYSAGAINVNTAPEELLRLVYVELGLGGIEGVLAARAKGQAVAAPTIPASASVSLVAASPVWQALIRTRWRAVQRSWWVVLTVGNQDKWEILQRHDADR